ncbi:plasmid stabilization protein ParE [Methylobacterium indicum]|uniref:Toxin n=1 Tax=Methylobacterium indicum TaxID=1775910 RepID=A0A0J6R5N2_9HYPH|nr:type II toxin-antitoxin system RelE/ParE family toxin [Methylobacterium indicum]KMO16873.1 plasmid stabilization protein ParE [Methylobacterium indicum]KMO19585.1 plasmid stabilization protein ParE [Methylobacterium indicum]KTS26912.1 plasmid stabilization protein ParE [Methylobacterium indicum]KTS37430.1 plasmid stabilization protein ParE [Methylobacterium indicum]KTS51096.1 plasmid stabilization protein ParE [Methylobacterium indicum]
MRIRLSAAARRDLSGIWSYSAEKWDRAQADRYIRVIADGFDRLAAGTAKSRSADDIRRGYFKLVVGSHVVFYRKGASDVIEVVRILHQQMDFDRHL